MAALLHAGWNALLRLQGDRFALMVALSGASAAMTLPVALWLGPPERAAWGWLALSACLHFGYNLTLTAAYAHGELGRIYPLARGAAPAMTLLASALLLPGDRLPATAVAGVLLVSAGIAGLALEGGRAALSAGRRGVALALLVGVFVCGYTLSDGLGARASGAPLTYTAWLFVLNGLPLVVLAVLRRGRGALPMLRAAGLRGVAAGAMGLVSYGIAIWAFTQAPIALVGALRETSVVFAVLIGVAFLGERLRAGRLAAIAVVFAGLVLMRV